MTAEPHDRDADLEGMLAWFSVVTGAREKAQEIADLAVSARDGWDAANHYDAMGKVVDGQLKEL